MAESPQRKRLIVLLVVLVVVAVVALVMRLRDSGGGARAAVEKTEKIDFTAHELPLINRVPDQEAGRQAGVSIQRNPFAFGAPPTPTRNLTPPPTLPPPPPRTPRPRPTQRVIVGPGGEQLPPPPRFDKEYIGHLGPHLRHRAVFRSDEELEVAEEGWVMDEVFILREIGLESVVIGFVGYPEKETTRVPLAEK